MKNSGHTSHKSESTYNKPYNHVYVNKKANLDASETAFLVDLDLTFV